VRNRTTKSALLVMGAAAGVAAAAWLNKRRLTVVNTSDDPLVEPEAAELPLGRSADRGLDVSLSRKLLPQDDTSGAALHGEREPFDDEATDDKSLDEIWNADSDAPASEQGEGYDAVNPESLGGVWLERATQTTHQSRSHGSDAGELAELEGFTISEATLASSGLADEEEPPNEEEAQEDEDDDEIRPSELDLPGEPR
jgi:hypothetical protein